MIGITVAQAIEVLKNFPQDSIFSIATAGESSMFDWATFDSKNEFISLFQIWGSKIFNINEELGIEENEYNLVVFKARNI